VGDEARRGSGSPDPVEALRKDLDELRRQVRDLSGRLLPSWTAQGVVCEEVPAELRAPVGIEQGLLVRQVRPGSRAEARGLRPSDVAVGMTEARLLEAIGRSQPIIVVREGRRVTLEGR
jgi:S1-C subfamily serine protease